MQRFARLSLLAIAFAGVSSLASAQHRGAHGHHDQAIRNGQQAATSLSTGASGGPAESGFPSQAELARMYLEDPEKAEGIIARMKRAGVLS